MKQNKRNDKAFVTKIFITAVIALLMFIPLLLIRSTIDERSSRHTESVRDITRSWGGPQTFAGPKLYCQYEKKAEKEKEKELVTASLFPEDLKYAVDTKTQELHRSIFDVTVYTAEIEITGDFVLDERFAKARDCSFRLGMDELKGLQGQPRIFFGDRELKVKGDQDGLLAELDLSQGRPGEPVPFRVTLKVNGSESLSFKPVGNLTEVEMASDYPDPSFCGDFLPVERDVRADGFHAKWQISQITTASPTRDSFGVRLSQPVTQYRQTERATKYGILIILLVFLAGFFVEMVSKRPINLIQYLVIGASLVLFYALLLAFSDFLSFRLSYLIAAGMTTLALGAYFRGIVKNRWAYLLTAMVALSYGVSYVLLQMETFAFLAGTLLLFLLLCVIMYLTRNLRLSDPGAGETEGKYGPGIDENPFKD